MSTERKWDGTEEGAFLKEILRWHVCISLTKVRVLEDKECALCYPSQHTCLLLLLNWAVFYSKATTEALGTVKR